MLNRQFSIIQKVFFVIIYLAVLLLQPTALKLARLFLLRLLYFLHLRRMNFYLYNIICQMSLYKDLINYDLCRFFVVYVQFPDDAQLISDLRKNK